MKEDQNQKVQIRYIVNDVDAAIAFYTQNLDFKLVMHPAPSFAMLSREYLRLVLSKPNPYAGGWAGNARWNSTTTGRLEQIHN